jgi:SGNH domain (fused to AT3 domains)
MPVWESRLKRLLSGERLCEYDPSFIENWQRPSITFVENFAQTYQAPVIDPFPCFSSPQQGGIDLYRDVDHLNAHGSEALIPCFARKMDDLMKNRPLLRQDF